MTPFFLPFMDEVSHVCPNGNQLRTCQIPYHRYIRYYASLTFQPVLVEPLYGRWQSFHGPLWKIWALLHDSNIKVFCNNEALIFLIFSTHMMKANFVNLVLREYHHLLHELCFTNYSFLMYLYSISRKCHKKRKKLVKDCVHSS